MGAVETDAAARIGARVRRRATVPRVEFARQSSVSSRLSAVPARFDTTTSLSERPAANTPARRPTARSGSRGDRQSVVKGTRVSVRVDHGGRRFIYNINTSMNHRKSQYIK